MGWFDGESSDEDEKQRVSLVQKSTGAQEDEEDPLDAYMKTLSNEQSASSDRKPASRLDLDNDEEATSHWESGGAEGSSTEAKNQAQYESQQRAKDLVFQKATDGEHDGGTLGSNANANSTGDIPEEWNWPFEKCFLPMEQQQDTEEGQRWRKNNEVRMSPLVTSSSRVTTIDPIYHLEELREVMGEKLLTKIHELGFHTPTTVQSQTLPLALSGHDILVTAATGQGKTLAFIWPIVVHIAAQLVASPRSSHAMGPIALVLVPTRELATQIHRQVAKPLLSAISAISRPVIGGQGKYILQKELKEKGGVDLVVATPGRLVDVAADFKGSKSSKKGLSLSRVSMLVLDEADRLLSMGFEKQIRNLLQQIRPDRQTLFFSATMSRRIEGVAREWLSPSAIRLSVGRTGKASEHVTQHVMVLPSVSAKTSFILEMIPDLARVGRTLVFVATRESCESLAKEIREAHGASLTVETLHGDKHQSDRVAALKSFTAGAAPVLIATDVAARGLDVANISTVLNYDPAKTLDAHVHRVGRAGRLTKDHQGVGTAYTLLTPKNADFAHSLLDSLERDGREVSLELRQLAKTSRRSGNVASRNRQNKSGLGFDTSDATYGPQQGNDNGQSSTLGRPTKRSRWT